MEIVSEINTPERVGFGTRFGALIIDIVIISVIAFIIGMVGFTSGILLGGAAGAGIGQTPESAIGGSIFGAVTGFVAGTLLATFIYSLLEAFTGLTIGKLLLGILIRNENGSEGNTQLYLKRWAIKNMGTLCNIAALFMHISFISTIGSLCSVAIFIGCFLALRDNKQTLHDLLAKTAVYRK